MNDFIFGLKREYWEYKRLLVIVPLIVTAIFFLMAMAATWTYDIPEAQLAELDSEIEIAVGDKESQNQANEGEIEGEKKDEKFWFSGVYLASAWMAALFYALSSLYRDRRDKSILYWKTMPVSELQNVLSKYVFSVVGFSAMAIIFSWISAIILIAYAHLVFPPEMLPDGDSGMSFEKLVVWPFLAIAMALVWCAPIFALFLYASSRAKRMPVLTLLVPLVLIIAIEGIIFRSNEIRGFLFAHSPFALLKEFSEMENAGQFLKTYLVDSVPSLILGLLIAAIFFWRAAWHRNHNFEL